MIPNIGKIDNSGLIHPSTVLRRGPRKKKKKIFATVSLVCPNSMYIPPLTKKLALIHEDLQAPVTPETNHLTPNRSGLDIAQKASTKSAIGSENRLVRALSSPKLFKEALRSPFRSLRRGRRLIHASTSDVFASQDCSPIPIHSSPLRTHPSPLDTLPYSPELTYSPIPTPPGAPRLSFSVLHKEPGLITVRPPQETLQSSLCPAPAVDSPIGNPLARTTVRDSVEAPAGSSSSVSALRTPQTSRVSIPFSNLSPTTESPSLPYDRYRPKASLSVSTPRTPEASRMPVASWSVSPAAIKSPNIADAQAHAPAEISVVSFGVHEAQVAIRARPKLIDSPAPVARGRSNQRSAPEPTVKRLASPFQASSGRVGS